MLSNITDSSLKAMAGLKREDESMEDLFKRIGKRAQGNHARAVLHRRCAADRGPPRSPTLRHGRCQTRINLACSTRVRSKRRWSPSSRPAR